MKILHSSDIHLKSFNDERWNALKEILRIGKQENIDIFAISGDLFNKDVNAEELRPKLRHIFTGNGFKILILPGNHDKKSFRGGFYFGEDVHILNDLDESYETQEACFWGIPYEKLSSEETYNKLHSIKSKLKQDKPNILLYHGELLNTSLLRTDFGEEGVKRYMPSKISFFKDLNFDYVLAGHFHSKFEVWKFDDEKYFVYPGSPISITKKENSKRKVNIFDIGNPPQARELDTPYYMDIYIEFNPLKDFDPIEKVKNALKPLDSNTKVNLKVRGYLNCEKLSKSEEEIVNDIKDCLPTNCVEEIYEFRDISTLLNDELFNNFQEKLTQRGFTDIKRARMLELVIKSMRGINL